MRFLRSGIRVGLVIAAFSAVSMAQLSGTKTVGTGGDYTTIASAIAALNANGVSGPVVFSLTDATYAETGASLVIKAVTNAPTAVKTVTFKPAAGKSPVVTISGCSSTAGAAQYSGITDSCTSYITIDGSNTAAGTTRDLTFQINDAANGRNVLALYGNCDSITVRNTKFVYQAIYPNVNAGDATTAINVLGQSSGAADYLTIENCQIADAAIMPTYGITVQGYATAPQIYGSTVTVKNNTITSRWRGVYYYYLGAAGKKNEISGNTITSPSTATTFAVYGIQVRTSAGTTNVFNNKVVTLKSNTATSGSIGLAATVGSVNSIVNVYNNFIGDMYDIYTTTVPTATQYGMSFGATADSGTYNVYHNTVVMPNNCNTSGNVVGVYVGSLATVSLKNNIIVNNYNTTTAFGIYKNTTTSTLTSDYNDLSVVSSRIGYLTTAKLTLADWQTASAGDARSKTDSVFFASATDFHLIGTSVGNKNLSGTTGLGITTDIDGAVRSTTNPYMGADEAAALPATSVASKTGILPSVYTLAQNYPNPFNPSTTIEFAVPLQSRVAVKIYSMLGQEVRTLVNDIVNPGTYTVVWNGGDNKGVHLASGVYFVRISADAVGASAAQFVQVRRMLMLQ